MSGTTTDLDTLPSCGKITIKNFKSIGFIDAILRPMTIVTGRNGSGKSNFVDAFRFLKESIQSSLEFSIRARHGIDRVRRHSIGHPFNFGIRLDINIHEPAHRKGAPAPTSATYAFEISSGLNSTFSVNRELLLLKKDGEILSGFDRRRNRIQSFGTDTIMPRLTNMDNGEPVVPNDSLLFTTMSQYYGFYSVSRAISNIEIYSIDPSAIRGYQ